MISLDDFKKVELRVGIIRSAEKIPETDKLLTLAVDLGEEIPRSIVSGIAEYFPDPANLIGKPCIFVTNLEPKSIRGHESNGMILAIKNDDGSLSLVVPDGPTSAGSRVN